MLVAVATVAVAATARCRLRLGRLLDHEAFRGEQQAGDRDGVGDRVTGHLHRVDDAGRDQVDVLVGGRVEAVAPAQLGRLARHHVAVVAGVLRDPAQRLDQRLADDGDAERLLTGQAQAVVEHRRDLREGRAATGDGAFLDRGLGRRDGVLDAVLALFHLDLGHGTDLDHRDATGELGQPLRELLAVPVGVRGLDLLADLRDPVGDLVGLAATVDDGGALLVDHDPPGGAQHVDGDLVELVAQLRRDQLAAGGDRQVLQHRLAPVTEARRLHRGDLEGLADRVDHEGRQGLALDVLGDDQQRLAGLENLFQQRQHLLDAGDLLSRDEQVGVLEDGLLRLGVGHEVGRDEALVELQALGDLELGQHRRALLDGDDAVAADPVHRLGDQLTDGGVLRRDGRDVGDRLVVVHLDGLGQQGLGDGLGGEVHAALEADRVGARGHVAQALADQRLSQDGRRGGAVAGDVVGLGRHLFDQLGAEVLVRVGELDLLGDGDTVVGDRGRAELLVQDDVAAARAEGDLDRVGERVDAVLEQVPGVVREAKDFRHV